MKNIPFIPGMYPGVGCNPLTGRLFDSPFKQVDLYSPKGATGQTVEFGLHTVTSTQDLSKKLNFGTSVSFVAGPFSTVSVAARLLREHTVSAHHLYLLVAVVVTHSHEVLTTFALKPEVSSLLKGKALDRFHASYGHGFIAGFVRGDATTVSLRSKPIVLRRNVSWLQNSAAKCLRLGLRGSMLSVT
jgi:hypothetical protein